MFEKALSWFAQRSGHLPLAAASAEVGELGVRLARGPGWVVGVNGGSHDAGVALVRVQDGEARLVLNAEEERWSRKKHDWGAPNHAMAEAVRVLRAHGSSADDITAVGCGWDFAAFAALWSREVGRSFPRGLALMGGEGFVDLTVARRLPSIVGKGLERPGKPLLAVPHHDAHAWGSLLLSPFHGEGEPVLVVVMDGMGDRGSLSIYLAKDGLEPLCLHNNESVFDSLGLMYQWLSSTQGGWTPLASEGRFMGAAAWGEQERNKNKVYADLRPMMPLKPNGRVHLDRRWINWHRNPRRPYGPPMAGVLPAPILGGDLWDPNAVLDPDRQEVPELTAVRLDVAAAVQMLLEDAVAHVVDHWVAHTGASRVIWTGGVALNGVAAMRILRDRPELLWWTPPFPGDNGVAAGAALRLAWASGAVQRVEPLGHAFIGGGALSRADITKAVDAPDLTVRPVSASDIPGVMSALLHRGAILGLAQGQAETGPRALGHRSILADPTRSDALQRINQHVKRRESVRPLAPMMLADEAERWFELPSGTRHHDLSAWRSMVLCARAKPGAREALPAVIHRDGTARLQVVDPAVDPVCAAILDGMRRLNGHAVLVNTSLNVGEPIAHSASDVIATLRRARDLHGVLLVDEVGQGWLVSLPDRPAGCQLGAWLGEL